MPLSRGPVWHDISHTIAWLTQNINQTLDSQNTLHISSSRASYGVYIVRILEKMDCIITTPHCIWLPIQLITFWWIVLKHLILTLFNQANLKKCWNPLLQINNHLSYSWWKARKYIPQCIAFHSINDQCRIMLTWTGACYIKHIKQKNIYKDYSLVVNVWGSLVWPWDGHFQVF